MLVFYMSIEIINIRQKMINVLSIKCFFNFIIDKLYE